MVFVTHDWFKSGDVWREVSEAYRRRKSRSVNWITDDCSRQSDGLYFCDRLISIAGHSAYGELIGPGFTEAGGTSNRR
jgi:hypothetical protein